MSNDRIQVWAVLKPGFLALLGDPFDTKPLDIIVFDVLPASDGNGEGRVSLAAEVKERNPLRHAFKVSRICAACSVENFPPGGHIIIYILLVMLKFK